MRLLITEFICGGGLANKPLPESLQQEGQSMLQALVSDCLAIANCEVISTLDNRLPSLNPACKVVQIDDAQNYLTALAELAEQVDYVWVVAPESDEILEKIVCRMENQAVQLINADTHSIRLCADKLRCADLLREAGIDVVPSLPIDTLRSYLQKVLIKPRNGAGCEGVQVFSSGLSAINYINHPDQWIVQPYIQGEHCSMSILCCNGKARILSCNGQVLGNMLTPKLEKCIVNAFPFVDELAHMADRIAYTFPGLQGYVGVDFIKTKHNYVLVEVNPRLTTSYIGLKKALHKNPAQLCLDAIVDKQLPDNIDFADYNVEVVIG